MKIACIADLHLNKTVYKNVMDKDWPTIPFRSGDFMRAFQWMVDECINNIHPDIVALLGDIYDTYDPTNVHRGFFSQQLKKLTDANIPVIILIGNHDVCMKHHSLKDIFELDLRKIRVIESPEIITLKDNRMRLLLFPYSIEIERKNITPKEEFRKFLEKIKQEKQDIPTIFFGHIGVQGAKMNEYDDLEKIQALQSFGGELKDLLDSKSIAKKDYLNHNPNDISMTDLDEIGCKYVVLGDFHEHQILKTQNCVATYPGSIERSNMLHRDQKKGFIVYDSEAKEEGALGKCMFIEYPNCRPMLQMEGNFEAIKNEFDKLDASKYQGAVVRMVFKGNSNELIEFSSNMEAFKKQLKEKINPIHIYHDQEVINEAEETPFEIEKEMMERGHIESQDVLEVVKEIIKEQKKDNNKEMGELIKLADEIYAKTMEPK